MKIMTLLGVALGTVAAISITTQFLNSKHFMAAGARFTAKDGQALCERIRRLESLSHGYQETGETSETCEYQKHEETP